MPTRDPQLHEGFPPGTLDLRWTVYLDGPLAGAVNMAWDHALALGLAPEAAILRLYRWSVPTLSLGRNEPARGRYDLEGARRLGVDVVRRPTGGRAVLHWRELTYAVALPVSALGPRAAYRWINERLAVALASLGVPAEITHASSSTDRPDAGPCFGSATAGELMARGRKLVGSAQARLRTPEGDVLLQHGSILVEDDQGVLEQLRDCSKNIGFGPATLVEMLGRPPAAGELERAVLDAFAAHRNAVVARVTGVDESARVAELVDRYRSDAWTWRR